MSARPAWRSYAVAILGAAAAVAARLALDSVLGSRGQFLLALIPIFLTGFHLGLRPALACAAASVLGTWYFVVEPRRSFAVANPEDVGSLVLYAVAAGLMIAFAHHASRMRQAAQTQVAVLQRAKRGDEARARLGAIVDSSDDAIVSKDLNGIVNSWNAGAERIFSYTAAEMIGRNITTIIPPENLDEEVRILSRIRRGERVSHFETVRRRKDGSLIDVSLTVSPVHDDDGKVIGASKIARDISEAKRVRLEIAAQREWFRVTLESIGDAVIATDERGNVAYLNPVAEALTGWTSAQAVGRPCAEVFHIVDEETGTRAENPVDRVLAEGSVVGLANHTVLIAQDGQSRPIDDSGAPIKDAQGRIIGVVLVFRDVSERRRIEAERRAVNAEREHLLENERAARAEAERANRTKDEFVSALSHELRTPLNAIMGWSEILRRPQCDEATRARGLEAIERNTRVQARLISDLLDMSRIVSGKLRLELQSVEPEPLLREAIDSVRKTAEAKRLSLQLVAESTPSIAADPARLQQVVSNLLTNSIKFTPEGGSIEVALRPVNGAVEIAVADTGIGIKQEFLPHLFERFRQADASMSRRYGGLGLGLAIVKQLVELHGGSVDAGSAGENLGATVTVRLPVGVPGTLAAPPEPPPETPARHPLPSFAGLTVLVVEDDADTRVLFQRFLGENGARIVEAKSADEALRALEQERPDLVVSDIGLPGDTGYNLIARIRSHPDAGLREVPAIAVTAYARAEDRLRALQNGFQGYLAKPVQGQDLLVAVGGFAHRIFARRSPPNAP